ncbi:MAG: hypothetical protein P4M11_02010 [Candidatus Pacebacteria bacterium]|nr:hypothetical protein [Candidatus Paceibacterota bacterium]
MSTKSNTISKRSADTNGGYVAILVVLMIVAAGALLATTMSLIGAGGIQSSNSLTQGDRSLGFTEGCAEDALLKISASANYAGGTVTRPEGTCIISISTSTNVYTVIVGTAATDYVRTIKIVGTRGATNFTILSWSEV